MKKKSGILLSITIVILVLLTLCFFSFHPFSNESEAKREKEIDLTEIKKKYQPYVKTNKVASLYKKEENKYVERGTVEKDVVVALNTENELKENKNAIYLPLKNMNYFISYQDVEVAEQPSQNTSYQNYIVFNENVKTEEMTKFYQDGVLVYSLSESINLPIIIKDTDYYYVEYAGELLGVKKDEVTVENHENTKEEVASSVATLNYHFFYDETNRSECQQSICHHVDQFRGHLNYLKENGFYTLKMHDMELFVDGKIQLPKKSVLITFDDGWLADKGIALLNEFQMNGTVFLITSSYPDPKPFQSDYVETHSHGDNLHFPGACPGGQGGAIKCYEEEILLKDLALSREKLGGSTVFCYPFYEYNDYAISILKKAGFTMAFIGGNRDVTVGMDKMKLPRYPITSSTTVSDLARIVN